MYFNIKNQICILIHFSKLSGKFIDDEIGWKFKKKIQLSIDEVNVKTYLFI